MQVQTAQYTAKDTQTVANPRLKAYENLSTSAKKQVRTLSAYPDSTFMRYLKQADAPSDFINKFWAGYAKANLLAGTTETATQNNAGHE